MKVSYIDTRDESLRAARWRETDNPDATSEVTDTDAAIVTDVREISIRREDGDNTPDTGESLGNRRAVTFSLTDITIRWERTWRREVQAGTDNPRIIHTGWGLTNCTVSGPQIKADGKLSTRIYNTVYPYPRPADDWLDKARTDGVRVGTYTPVPEWLARVLMAYSPITGTPYLYGDSHTYGSYSPGYERSPALEACLYPGV